MSGNAWIGLAVGLVVGIFTAGIGFGAYALTAGLLAFSVTSSLLASRTANKSLGASGIKDAVASEFEMTSASESINAPVIFGVVRNPGNYIRYDKSSFYAVPIYGSYQQPSGGKGGEPATQEVQYISGYNYYMSFDVGLCMGTIDKVRQVYDGTKLTEVGGAYEFEPDDESTLLAIGNSDTGGNVRLYRGSSTQTRVPGEVYSDAISNYRDVCFASFQNFWIGQQTTPRTFLFELQRWPRPVDDNGEIADFPITGSYDDGNEAYDDANPAACIYEILTNETWGAAIPRRLIELESFKRAAQYYAAKNIGVSFSMESQDDLASYIDTIRQHVNLVIVWDGLRIRAVVMMDTENNAIVDVVSAENCKEPVFSRPAWPSMTNELNVRFTNRHAGFKVEMVKAQDTAAITNAGRVNSRQLQMNGLPSRLIAEAQTARLLAELSFPQATLSFEVNRSLRARPGELIQFEWDEWSAGKAYTFWRVRSITEKEDGFKVECVEDLYSTPYEGEAEPYESLTPAYYNRVFNNDSDLVLDEQLAEPGSLAPVIVVEQNIWLSRNRPAAMVVAESGKYGHINNSVYFQPDGGEVTFIGTNDGKVATGTLVADMDAENRGVMRDRFMFEIDLNDEDAATAMIASAAKIQVATDHFATVLSGNTDLLVIGDEVFVVGRVVPTATEGRYEVQAYIRAMQGTKAKAHAAGDVLFFLLRWTRGYEVVLPASVPINTDLSIIVHPITTRGESTAAYEWNGQLQRAGIAPFEPELVSVAKAGTDWTVRARPRWHVNGAQTGIDFETELAAFVMTPPAGYAFFAQTFAGAVAVSDMAVFASVFTPDDGLTRNGGTIVGTVDMTGADNVKIWAVLDGKKSIQPMVAE